MHCSSCLFKCFTFFVGMGTALATGLGGGGGGLATGLGAGLGAGLATGLATGLAAAALVVVVAWVRGMDAIMDVVVVINWLTLLWW